MNAMFSITPGGAGMSERDPLAFVARHAGPEFGGPVDTSADLLHTIAEVLYIRSVFPRVSDIVKPVLPHDALELMFHDRGGHVTLEARSTDDLEGHPGWTGTDAEPFFIVKDLRRPSSRFASGDLADFVDHLLAVGYRSALNVRSVARNQVMRLGFFSKQLDAYGPNDVPTAQHIADYVAVAVAHEQLAAVERDRAEARGRAERLDARVRALAEKGESLSRGRMVGRSDAWRRVLAKA